MEHRKTMSTAETSKCNEFCKPIDIESIKDAKVLYLAAALTNAGNNENLTLYTNTNVTEEYEIVKAGREVITSLADNFCQFVNTDDFNEIKSILGINFNIGESGNINTDLLTFYMMFLVFNEKVSINGNLDRRLKSCLKHQYLDYCETIIDNKLLSDTRHEEEMWELAVELITEIRK